MIFNYLNTANSVYFRKKGVTGTFLKRKMFCADIKYFHSLGVFRYAHQNVIIVFFPSWNKDEFRLRPRKRTTNIRRRNNEYGFRRRPRTINGINGKMAVKALRFSAKKLWELESRSTYVICWLISSTISGNLQSSSKQNYPSVNNSCNGYWIAWRHRLYC